MRPLLDFAASTIPTSQHSSTPIFLFATAGMRLVPLSAQTRLLNEACSLVRSEYGFLVAPGYGCDMAFQVISGILFRADVTLGELEGIFGWLTVNYLKHGLAHSPVEADDKPATYGFLDMVRTLHFDNDLPLPNVFIQHTWGRLIDP